MTQAVARLAQHVVTTRFEDLPPAAIAAAKVFFLDTLGVCVAGTSASYAAEVRAAAYGWGMGNDATVLGLGERLPAANAAFVNAYHTHCQEYDSVHEPAVVHALATIQSAVLAHAEKRGGILGKDLLLALALGVDVAASIGMAAKTGLKFFRPATAGIFGVAAAVGKLARLDVAGLMDAFGLAYSQAAGTMQAHVEGKPTLALQIAFAAAAGMRAVDLAKAGFPGPHDVLEGPFGFYRLFEGAADIEPVWAELGKVWRITQVSHKPFPAGRATHGGIDGIMTLKAEHGVRAENIAKLTLRAPPLIHQLVGRPLKADMKANYARLCFQYVGAVALSGDSVEVADFRPERLQDPALLSLANRIEVVIDGNPDPNALKPQTVVAKLSDGREITVDVPETIGSPAKPLSREQHLAKFRRCLGHNAKRLAPNTAERLISLTDRLDQLFNSEDIIQALKPA
ncbi:MAG: MmgE/PrpD family protein [Gammaproteobacteria bacterium]